jgi:ParB family chromosome partitioning protein
MLEEAYKTGQLKGHELTDAKRLMEKRREKGPKAASRPKLPNSAHSLVKTYQKEVARQHKMVLKAQHAHQQLLLVVQGLKALFADENFVTCCAANRRIASLSYSVSSAIGSLRAYRFCRK